MQKLEAANPEYKIPSFKQWKKQWAQLSPLEKAVTALFAENADFFGDIPQQRRYFRAIAAYLVEMGAVEANAPTLREEAPELWADYKN